MSTTKVIHHPPSNTSDARFANPPASGVTFHPAPGTASSAPQGPVSVNGLSKTTQVETPPDILEMIQERARREGRAVPQTAHPAQSNAPAPLPGVPSIVSDSNSTVIHHAGTGVPSSMTYGAGWERGAPGPNFVRHPVSGKWTSRDSLRIEEELHAASQKPPTITHKPVWDDSNVPPDPELDDLTAPAEHLIEGEHQPSKA